ncbi:hypothetical protein PR048_008909 [Dryococelus australis]|uniref:Uncharacterized protein n=1 Tax=Dryococelus australis TaxID=614101 RepID=A0ABQ9HYF2_9NEOP|nr:hypothetical protein PR048_008909 [Dryococelus australis]
MQHVNPFLNPVMSQERFLYSQTLLTYLNLPGFESSSSEKIQITCIQKLLDMSLQDLKFTFKFSQQYVNVSRTQ